MGLKDLALEESKGILAFFVSLFFVRLIEMNSPYHSAVYAVFGVPPWRNLTAVDTFSKPVIPVYER